MRLKEVLQAGIWREKVSSKFYERLAKKVSSDLKLLIEYLSVEELEHEKFLRSLYKSIYGEDPGEVKELGGYEFPDFEVRTVEELIDIGIEKEKESKYYYMDLFCQLESYEEKEKIVDLINFEDGHIKKLESAKNKGV
ncbi:MAG: ferritin family protein [candidate division WOR-3 bacterium]